MYSKCTDPYLVIIVLVDYMSAEYAYYEEDFMIKRQIRVLGIANSG
jgi:hypothetical protein